MENWKENMNNNKRERLEKEISNLEDLISGKQQGIHFTKEVLEERLLIAEELLNELNREHDR